MANARERAERVPRHGRGERTRRWLARARRPGGQERQTLEQIGKGTVAATVSWWIAHDLLAAQSPAFAPFSAVLILQVTVYRSVWHALRYLGAVCAGVAMQGALGFLAGPGIVTFALVALISLALARWNRLGSQGSQVATAAFFAFSTYAASATASEGVGQLGMILAIVGVGCGVGFLTNVLVLPPMGYRSAEESIRSLAVSLCELLADIHPVLREEELDKERTDHWRVRATGLGKTAGQSQAVLRTAQESKYYNPRRLLPRHRYHKDFPTYGEILNALERITYQIASLTRSLDQWPEEETGPARRDFLADYGDLLESLAHVVDQFSEIAEGQLSEQAQRLCEATETARRRRTRLEERAREAALPLQDPSWPYSILLAEAARLTEEAQHACDLLRCTAQQAASDPGSGSGEADEERAQQ